MNESSVCNSKLLYLGLSKQKYVSLVRCYCEFGLYQIFSQLQILLC